MRFTQFAIVLLLITTLVVLGCSSDDSLEIAEGGFLGGTQGIVADFEPFGVEEEGKLTIFNTEAFPIEVTVQNKGEYDTQAGDVVVSLLGPSPEEFSGIASSSLPNAEILDPISELVPEGGEETITFASDATYEGSVSGFVDRTWFGNIEYRYQTYTIVSEVCLKEDLSDSRICDVNGAKTFFVSGAPITVTKVEEDTAGKGIMAVKFTVSNVGGGDVTVPGQEFSATTDKLAFSLDDPEWECKSAGKVNEARLRDGKADIVCKLKEALQEDALSTKQVKLTLQYKYRDIIQEKIRIKESAE